MHSNKTRKKSSQKNYIKKPTDPSREHHQIIADLYLDEPFHDESNYDIPPKTRVNKKQRDLFNEHAGPQFPSKKTEPFFSDEEENMLLTPSKRNGSMNSMTSEFSACEPNEKLSAYFLMFCNICRSFIAIGVLSIPYGLSKCGKHKISSFF